MPTTELLGLSIVVAVLTAISMIWDYLTKPEENNDERN